MPFASHASTDGMLIRRTWKAVMDRTPAGMEFPLPSLPNVYNHWLERTKVRVSFALRGLSCVCTWMLTCAPHALLWPSICHARAAIEVTTPGTRLPEPP